MTVNKYNLKRHHYNKHNQKKYECTEINNIQEKAPLNEEKTPQNEEKTPPNKEKTPLNEKSVTFDESVKEYNIKPCKNKLYQCKNCNKQYNTQKYLNNHQEKCKGIDILTCPKCMKTFSNTNHKSRHIKANRCKARSILYALNKDTDKNIENISTYQYIGNQNNVNIQNQQNNFYINNLGSERTDYITYDELKHILMQGNDTLPMYIGRKHFDKNFPENHNIKYTKNNKCIVYENNKWKERELVSLSSMLVKENSRNLLLYCCNNEIRLACDVMDDEIIQFVKRNLSEVTYKMHKNFNDIKTSICDLVKNADFTDSIEM